MTSFKAHIVRLYAQLFTFIRGIYLDRSIGLDSIAMLVIVALLLLSRVVQ